MMVEPGQSLQPLLCPRSLRVMAALVPEVDDLQSRADWTDQVHRQLNACAQSWVPIVMPSQWRPLYQGWWHSLLAGLPEAQRRGLCLKMSLSSAGAALTDAVSAQAWAQMRTHGVGLIWDDLAWPQGWAAAVWQALKPDGVILGARAQALLRRDLDDTQATKTLERQIQDIQSQGVAVWAGPLTDAQALYRAQQMGCSGVWGELIMQPMSVPSFLRLHP